MSHETRPCPILQSTARLVLVVEPCQTLRRLLGVYLNRAGYEVAEAGDGEAALQYCRLRRPDFILSAWMMPAMSGLDLCRQIRADADQSYVYFILLSTRHEPGDIAFGLENGADDILGKPVAAVELLARLSAGERILRLQDDARNANARLSETLAALRAAQAAIDRDLNEARRLQQGLIGEREAHYGDFIVSHLLRPAGHVGGDITGSFAINARRFGVFAIDVSGHGVTAALLTARLATQFSASVDQNAALFINEFGLYESRAPAVLARYLNHLMLADLSTDTYFTMVYAVIDQLTGEVRLVQAGHPHPLLWRAGGGIEEIGNGGLPIGVIEDADYDEVTLTLNPGDRLLIASDGVWDAADASGRMPGPEDLEDALRVHSAMAGPDLLEELARFVLARTGQEQDDDISAVLIEYSGLAQRPSG